MKKFIKKFIFFYPAPTVFIIIFGYALVIAVFAIPIKFEFIEYFSYILSAYSLILTIANLPRFNAFIKLKKEKFMQTKFVIKIKSTKTGSKLFEDVRFRTEISIYQGLFINILYIAIEIFSGIIYKSVWFISLAIYYFLLALMRIILLYRGKNKKIILEKNEEEFRRYRACGIILLFMNQALAGIVIFIVYCNKGFEYSGILIYAIAMYAFYAFTTAIINIVKFRKLHSPVLSAAKIINFVAAMVSMLSLTTAMLARYGKNDIHFRAVMTGAVGGTVCTITIFIAIFMILKANINLKGKNHAGKKSNF